jgi:hypothetical protein
MKIHIQIEAIETLDSISGYWQLIDYQALLECCDVEDFAQMSLTEAEEMLFMALTDREPEEAAKVLLTYKFSEKLRAGQIEQMSHEMLEDCLPEEHADIRLHYDLFAINELLNRAFNNTFPEAKATSIRFKLKVGGTTPSAPSKELLIKSLALCFAEGQIITRLYGEQITGKVPFPEAESILWEVQPNTDQTYTILTSRYWLEREDFATLSSGGDVQMQKELK